MALAVGQVLYALEIALASSKNRGGGELDGTYRYSALPSMTSLRLAQVGRVVRALVGLGFLTLTSQRPSVCKSHINYSLFVRAPVLQLARTAKARWAATSCNSHPRPRGGPVRT